LAKQDKTKFDFFVETVATVGFIAMVVIVIVQVIFRSLSWTYMDWAFEVAGFLFVATIFLGAALAMRMNEHIRLEFLLSWLPPRPRLALELALDILAGVFLLAVAVGAYQMTGTTWELRNVEVEWMRTGHMYAALLLATILTLIYLIANVARHARALKAMMRSPGKPPSAANTGSLERQPGRDTGGLT